MLKRGTSSRRSCARALRSGLTRGVVPQDSQEALLQLRGNLHVLELGRCIDGAPVGVHECDAGPAPLDVPLQQFAGRFRERSVVLVAQQVGDLPTLYRRGARLSALGHRFTLYVTFRPAREIRLTALRSLYAPRRRRHAHTDAASASSRPPGTGCVPLPESSRLRAGVADRRGHARADRLAPDVAVETPARSRGGRVRATRYGRGSPGVGPIFSFGRLLAGRSSSMKRSGNPRPLDGSL